MAVVAQRRVWPALYVELFRLSVKPLSLDMTMPPRFVRDDPDREPRGAVRVALAPILDTPTDI